MNLQSGSQEVPVTLHAGSTVAVHGAGHLVALRTKAEAQAVLDITHAHVVQVAQKSANSLLRSARDTAVAIPPWS